MWDPGLMAVNEDPSCTFSLAMSIFIHSLVCLSSLPLPSKWRLHAASSLYPMTAILTVDPWYVYFFTLLYYVDGMVVVGLSSKAWELKRAASRRMEKAFALRPKLFMKFKFSSAASHSFRKRAENWGGEKLARALKMDVAVNNFRHWRQKTKKKSWWFTVLLGLSPLYTHKKSFNLQDFHYCHIWQY